MTLYEPWRRFRTFLSAGDIKCSHDSVSCFFRLDFIILTTSIFLFTLISFSQESKMFSGVFYPADREFGDEEQSQGLLRDEKSASPEPIQETKPLQSIAKLLFWTEQVPTKQLPTEERSFFPILSLDDSLLSKIRHHLSPIDQVCLGLSCKKLYAGSDEARRHEEFKFPRLLHLRIPILCVNSKDVPRNQLLLRLENDNWKYCSKCLKLHPRTEFGALSLMIQPLNRSCGYNAGIVDICPCYSWTLRDGEKIFNPPGSTMSDMIKGCVEARTAGQQSMATTRSVGQGSKWDHTCSFSISPGCDVRISTTISPRMSGLDLSTKYTIPLPPSNDVILEPLFACPHTNLLSITIPEGREFKCETCLCTIRRETPYAVMPCVLSVSRHLRLCDWQYDCRLTGTEFLKNEEYW